MSETARAPAHRTGDAPTFSPLYRQIKALITRSLQSGEWKPGELIPSETELAVLLREQVEGVLSSGAGATDTPLRDHGLYETFFAGLRKTLTDKSSPPPERK